MQLLRRTDEVSAFITSNHHTAIGHIIKARVAELTEDGTPLEDIEFFVILDDADTLSHLEDAIGAPLMTPTGTPLWEFIDTHPTCFEMVIVLDSSGYGATVFVPKQSCHPEILALCQQYAMPQEVPPT